MNKQHRFAFLLLLISLPVCSLSLNVADFEAQPAAQKKREEDVSSLIDIVDIVVARTVDEGYSDLQNGGVRYGDIPYPNSIVISP